MELSRDTPEGRLCLATVIDLCTREVVGRSMADHMRAGLVIDAVRMAHAAGRVEGNQYRRAVNQSPSRHRSNVSGSRGYSKLWQQPFTHQPNSGQHAQPAAHRPLLRGRVGVDGGGGQASG